MGEYHPSFCLSVRLVNLPRFVAMIPVSRPNNPIYLTDAFGLPTANATLCSLTDPDDDVVASGDL